MSRRPAVLTGSLLGVLALGLTAAPAQAAPLGELPSPHRHTDDRTAGGEGPRPVSDLLDDRAPAGAPRVVAHRGASAYAPENTLAGADKARDLDIEWVENDVQRTKDGELVVMHDETLERTTNVEEVFPDRAPWKVGDFTAQELGQLDAGGWFAREYSGERIPTLVEFLDRIVENDQKLLLELKKPELYPGIEEEVVEELRTEGWLRAGKRQDLVVQSFDADAVRTVHELAPRVTTGFLGKPAVSQLGSYAEFTDQINPRYTEVDEEYVRAVKRLRGAQGKQLEVYTWTVDDGPTAAKLAGMGVDGVISNRPDVVRDAMAAAGDTAPSTDAGDTDRAADDSVETDDGTGPVGDGSGDGQHVRG
ncbi:glycerophosphodiester phosphodiesterase [Streptomyces sp. XM4193]|uniref:glycerophosphodiester phosphodiesterase n=1 Tax=Streptomyces sp. XM4193 TaxID=2929782 RepID=UPI001FF945F6|nr:glycerophosphodiester phosphodiesterase family protein [Streptomyces sp. XM4193]MCK1796456.1 glycerophosphodiester phosphodiesterase [Streptomyces sp. XM4193]